MSIATDQRVKRLEEQVKELWARLEAVESRNQPPRNAILGLPKDGKAQPAGRH